jgi:sphingomyelin phosphodiesterase
VTSQDAPEDNWITSAFEAVGENSKLVVEEFAKAAPSHASELHNILREIAHVDDTNVVDNSTGCKGCQLIVSVLSYLVKMGYNHTEIEAPVEFACKIIIGLSGGLMPGNKVCPTVISNYGHHVARIMELNRNIPEESCYLMRSCSSKLPSIVLPPLSDLVGELIPSSPPTKEQWELPKKFSGVNYRTSQRTRSQRDWHTDPNILRVAQFTDIHVDEYYQEGAPTECGMPLCCRDLGPSWSPKNGSAGPYGEYLCNVPPSTTRLFINKAKELNPDIILYSGDSPPHHLWEETLEGQLNSTKWVAKELSAAFPSTRGIYSTLGNHECFPSNMYYPDHNDTAALHQAYIETYKDLSKLSGGQETTINTAGYYEILISPGLRLLAPNSNFGYTGNWYNLLHTHNDLFKNMVTWMDKTLGDAKAAGEKVIVLSHHPVLNSFYGYDEAFSALMLKYSDVVILNVVGHNHADEFRLFRDTEGTARGVQFLSQSSNSYSNVNPGVRMYYFDNTTYRLLGYEQYFLDIASRTAEVALLYKTDVDYSLNDLSPSALNDFVVRMQNDITLFNKFYKNIRTGHETGTCDDEECKKRTLCRQSSSTDELYDLCNAGVIPTDAPTNPPNPSPTDAGVPLSVKHWLIILSLALTFPILY